MASFPHDERKVVGVKGWYDQQNLAMVVNGQTVPSGIIGTVIPHPLLSTLTDASYQNKWVLTGFVSLDTRNARPGAIEYYKKKFNFDAVDVGTRLVTLNRISQCFGLQTECGVPNAPPGKGCADTAGGKKIAVWWVKLESPKATKPMYRCGIRRVHPNAPTTMKMAATARWRWVADDETTWIFCVNGCCETGSADGGWY